MTHAAVTDDIEGRLTSWLTGQLGDVDDVKISGFDRIEFGHSAETLLISVSWRKGGVDYNEDAVLRMRPPAPGLLPPYDLQRQFDILRCLEGTPVRAPRALWSEPTGDVLGRDFYIMGRLPGEVHERVLPEELSSNPELIRQMCHSMIRQLAAMHTVDLKDSGLDAIGDGKNYLTQELDRWISEIRNAQRGAMPGLERLYDLLCETQPEQCPTVTLVHGDPKVGNMAFTDGEVTGVFDWELAGIGDPLADLGWAEVLWNLGPSITNLPSSPSVEEFVTQWQELTGITPQNRGWYRAFQLFKMCTIQVVAGHLFDTGYTDDLRFSTMHRGIAPLTAIALRELGFDEPLETGDVAPRAERLAEVQQA